MMAPFLFEKALLQFISRTIPAKLRCKLGAKAEFGGGCRNLDKT